PPWPRISEEQQQSRQRQQQGCAVRPCSPQITMVRNPGSVAGRLPKAQSPRPGFPAMVARANTKPAIEKTCPDGVRELPATSVLSCRGGAKPLCVTGRSVAQPG